MIATRLTLIPWMIHSKSTVDILVVPYLVLLRTYTDGHVVVVVVVTIVLPIVLPRPIVRRVLRLPLRPVYVHHHYDVDVANFGHYYYYYYYCKDEYHPHYHFVHSNWEYWYRIHQYYCCHSVNSLGHGEVSSVVLDLCNRVILLNIVVVNDVVIHSTPSWGYGRNWSVAADHSYLSLW